MRSMTGVGRGTSEGKDWKVVLFVKTLNSKGLDISIKSNISLYELELDIRNIIRDYVRRGTTTLSIQLEPKSEKAPLDWSGLIGSFQAFKSLAEELDISLSDDMAFYASLRFAERKEEELNDEVRSLINKALLQALEELVKSRTEEGEKLKEDMKKRISVIKGHAQEIVEKKDELLEKLKQRVIERARELGLVENNHTVLSEMTFLVSRMDIEEEMLRFRVHLEKFEELLGSEGEVGRRLEFLLQEMHREINTLGSKMPELSHWAVEIKTEIDRLKQQVANVE